MSNNPMDADDILMNSGTAPPAAEWPVVGSDVEGIIVGRPQGYHVREYAADGKGELKYFPSGDPIRGIRVDLQTALRRADDNGIRRVYLESARKLSAVREAVALAGATGLEPSAWLRIMWTGNEQGQGSIPAKTWHAEYRRPNAAPVSVPTAPPQAPAYAPQATPAPSGYYAQPAPQQTPRTPAAAEALGRWTHPTPPPPMPMPAPQTYGGSVAPAPNPYGQAPTGAPAEPARVIPESVAAAMRNAGIDVSAFTIVPG